MRHRSVAHDLAEAVRSVLAGGEGAAPAERLSALEGEHRLLSERRRRLHESIDLLEGLDAVRPDAAARLERYKITEAEVSRRRQDLYREIGELRRRQEQVGSGGVLTGR
jgi:hypothetical protein